MGRALRVGCIGYDWPITWSTIDDVQHYPPEFGIEFAGYEIVPFAGCVDTSTEWLRLADKKPDWICVTCAGSSLTVLVKDSARLEIQ